MSIQSLSSVQRGHKLLKTKAKVLGRFLIRPDEEFNAMVARQLIDKAKKRHANVSTELRVFDTGVQLGDHGVFASMPLEFIRYHRLSDIIVLTNEPATVVVCVKDYEQRCVTVMRLKDSVSVKVVTDVINRQRTSYMEEFAKSSMLGSTLHRRVQQESTAYVRNGSNTAGRSNGEARDFIDGDRFQNGIEPDYAVISRRDASSIKPPAPPAPAQKSTMQGSSNSGGFFTRITVPAGPAHQQQQQQTSDWQTEIQHRQSLHEQYQARRSQLLQSAQKGNSTDDLEVAAVFETRDGPPTLLNEPSRYVARVTDGAVSTYELEERQRHSQGPAAGDGANWRLAQRGHFYKGSRAAY